MRAIAHTTGIRYRDRFALKAEDDGRHPGRKPAATAATQDEPRHRRDRFLPYPAKHYTFVPSFPSVSCICSDSDVSRHYLAGVPQSTSAGGKGRFRLKPYRKGIFGGKEWRLVSEP